MVSAYTEVPSVGMDGPGDRSVTERLLEAMVQANITNQQMLANQVDANQRLADAADRQRREARDARFVPAEHPIKITAADGATLLGELIAFEKQLERVEIRGGKNLYTRLLGAMDASLVKYMDELMQDSVGAELRRRALAAAKAGDGDKE